MLNKTALTAMVMTLLLVGCHDDDTVITPPEPMPVPPTFSYRITVTNLTNNQPLSPVAYVMHQSDHQLWSIGQPADAALELIAESGDNSMVLADTNVLVSSSDTQPLMPGNSYSSEITTDTTEIMLSVISMLVNTNDAFTGLNQHDLSGYAVGDTFAMNLRVYDSGTEHNSESDVSIPGPVSMGEGFNEARDDVNFVAMHSGVVTSDDGLSSSVLDQSHRFESVVAKVSIERTK